DYYVEDLAERLGVYQRLVHLDSLEEVDDLEAELRDRFGPIPGPVHVLLYTVKVRILADRCGVDSVVAVEARVTLALREPTGGARAPMQKILGLGVTVGQMQVRIEIDRDDEEWRAELIWTLEQIAEFQQRFLGVLAEAANAAGGE
ncbi:MAG: TRCF domain-containing protein, partial [Dehalococcoidia bacterium]